MTFSLRTNLQMHAVVLDAFGGPESLTYRLQPRPKPGPGSLLVRVMAASVNPIDYKIRLNGAWTDIRPPAIIGADAAGVVEETGIGVTRFRKGDEVFYAAEISQMTPGTYAEYHVVPETLVAYKPGNLSFVEAASLPLAASTAWQALFERGHIEIGDTVLIHAGSGGVGSAAIQMAKAAGARVITTCRKSNVDLVVRLGADVAIDYRVENVVDAVRKIIGADSVDTILDTVGGPVFAQNLELVKPRGRILSITASETPLRRAYQKNIDLHLIRATRSGSLMEKIARMVGAGLLKPVVDSVYPIERTDEAHGRIETGGVRGKVVLSLESLSS
jgi:NADPH:quinone reductase-like Zn-dependent oxidoreductase